MSIADQVEKLHKMWKDGLLSDQEYEAAKVAVISGAGPAPAGRMDAASARLVGTWRGKYQMRAGGSAEGISKLRENGNFGVTVKILSLNLPPAVTWLTSLFGTNSLPPPVRVSGTWSYNDGVLTFRYQGGFEKTRITWVNDDEFTGICIASSDPAAIGARSISTRVSKLRGGDRTGEAAAADRRGG
jgi:hypothetical protein